MTTVVKYVRAFRSKAFPEGVLYWDDSRLVTYPVNKRELCLLTHERWVPHYTVDNITRSNWVPYK